MKTVCKVILLGNVTRAPELKKTEEGKSLCTFGLATNRVWKDPQGQKQSLPEYHNILCWAGLADFCGQNIRVGMPLYVEGYLKTRSWLHPEHQDVKLFKTEVVADEVVFPAPRPEEPSEELAPDPL